MHLALDDFCEVVKKLRKTNAEKALAILWYHDSKKPDVEMTASELRKLLGDHHIGNSSWSAIALGIRQSKLAAESSNGFRLKPGSKKIIRDWLPSDLDGIQPPMDHTIGYLSEAVWRNTRGYIEAVCRQLNGCFKSAYYDAAAVMLRRLLETLIIESYEHLGRQGEIRDGSGNYFMLKDLVERACGDKGHAGLNLGRDSKATLRDAREIGNLSAHTRRYNAVASDLTRLQQGARVLVQELIHIANLKRI